MVETIYVENLERRRMSCRQFFSSLIIVFPVLTDRVIFAGCFEFWKALIPNIIFSYALRKILFPEIIFKVLRQPLLVLKLIDDTIENLCYLVGGRDLT